MKTLTYCLSCFSTSICRDAEVEENTGDVNTYQNLRCAECGYDGNFYGEVQITDEMFDECLRLSEVPEGWRKEFDTKAQTS